MKALYMLALTIYEKNIHTLIVLTVSANSMTFEK